jgi:hypothetical protein
MTQPPRIYADFNGLYKTGGDPEVWRVPLDTYGTLYHLAALRIVLARGVELTIFDESDDDEDLEADAAAVYDSESKCWMAEIDRKGYRYVPTRRMLIPTTLRCVNCGTSLDETVKVAGRLEQASCPECGTQANAPVLPPAAVNDA